MTDEHEYNPDEENQPIRKRSSGFISKISRWIPESWTGKIIAGTLAASIALGGLTYTMKKCSKSDINTAVKQTITQNVKNLATPMMPNTVKECSAYFPFNNSTKILNKDNFEECLDTLPKNSDVYVSGLASTDGSVQYNLNLSNKRADSGSLEKLIKSHGLTIKESNGYGETDRFGDLEKNRVAIVSVDPLGYEINADNEVGGKDKVHKKHKKVAKAPVNYNQCGDGFDNDGDTFVDMQDADCNSPLDNSEYTAGKPLVEEIDNKDKDKTAGNKDDGEKNKEPLPHLIGEEDGKDKITYYPIKIDVKENMPVEFRVPNSYLKRNPNARFSITAYDGGQTIKTLNDFDKTTIDKDMKYQSKENFPQSNTDEPYKYLIGVDEDGDGKLDIIDAGDDAVPEVLRKQLEINKVEDKKPVDVGDKNDNKRKSILNKAKDKWGKEKPDDYPLKVEPKEIDNFKKPDGHSYNGIHISPGIGIPGEFVASMMVSYVDGTDVASLDVNKIFAFTAEKNRDKNIWKDKTIKNKEDLECKTKDINLSWERDGWVNRKGNFDNTNEISGKPGTYIIKADEKSDYKVVDDKGVNISYQIKGNDIIFEMPEDVKSVKINTVYKEDKKECAKNLVIKNKKFKEAPIADIIKNGDEGPKGPKKPSKFEETVKKAAEKTGVFAGVTTGSYDEKYKNDSTDISYKGDTQTIGAGIVIKPTENVTITPYATQTEIKADVKDTASGEDFAEVKSENLTIGLNTEFKVDKKNSPFDDTKIELEAAYTKTDSSVDYTDFDIHAKQEQDGFIGIGDIEMPKLFHVTDNVGMGLGFKAVYSQEDGKMIDDSPSPDNTTFKLTKGLYSGKLLFNIDMDEFFIPDSVSFDLNYRSIDDTQSDETLKGMGLRNTLYFKHGKTYAELFGEFPINGNLKLTDYGAILGWDKLANKGSLSYLGFEFQGGVRNLEEKTSIDKDATKETYFTAGIKINTDDVLKFLKDPFYR